MVLCYNSMTGCVPLYHLTKFQIFACFFRSALSASMASIRDFVKFSVNNFDATLIVPNILYPMFPRNLDTWN